MKEANIPVDVIEVANDPGQSAELLSTYLRAHTDVGGVVTLGGPPNAGARDAKSTLGLSNSLLGGFDMDTATLKSIAAGDMLFTVDQQPYWRGYIPVLELTHNISIRLAAGELLSIGSDNRRFQTMSRK